VGESGTERLAEILRKLSDCEPETIIAERNDAMVSFLQGTPQNGDLTAVLIKRVARNRRLDNGQCALLRIQLVSA
jgi:hypothetical protein